MQQQTLLAVLLLLLTALAAVGGGMTPREPFMEEHLCKGGKKPVNGVCPEDDEPLVTNPSEEEDTTNTMSNGQTMPTKVPEENKDGFTNCDEDVEGFTGSMYAGF